jgi:hypothetical protein
MPQYSFKNKGIESCNLQKSRLLKLFERHAQIENLGANLQQKYSCRIKTILLANTGKYQTQMSEIFNYLPKIARYLIALRWNERYQRKGATMRSLSYLIINIWNERYLRHATTRSRPLNKNYLTLKKFTKLSM